MTQNTIDPEDVVSLLAAVQFENARLREALREQWGARTWSLGQPRSRPELLEVA